MFLTLYDSIFIFINRHNIYSVKCIGKRPQKLTSLKTVKPVDILNVFNKKRDLKKSTVMENHVVFNFNMASGLHKQIISPFR